MHLKLSVGGTGAAAQLLCTRFGSAQANQVWWCTLRMQGLPKERRVHPECKTVLGYTVSWQVRLLSLLWMSSICMEDHHTKALLYVSSLQKEAF